MNLNKQNIINADILLKENLTKQICRYFGTENHNVESLFFSMPWMSYPCSFSDVNDAHWFKYKYTTHRFKPNRKRRTIINLINNWLLMPHLMDLDDWISGITVACFTSLPFEKELWEKYAENSQGICLV